MNQYRVYVVLYEGEEFNYVVDAIDEQEAEDFAYEDYPNAERIYVTELN